MYVLLNDQKIYFKFYFSNVPCKGKNSIFYNFKKYNIYYSNEGDPR